MLYAVPVAPKLVTHHLVKLYYSRFNHSQSLSFLSIYATVLLYSMSSAFDTFPSVIHMGVLLNNL